MDNAHQNPYVGPRSFEEQDRRVFFGREEESRQLTALIIAQRVVLFYAPSGTGKTSLLNASVVPDLKQDRKVIVLPLSRVGGDLPPGLDDGQVSNIFAFNALLHLGVEADLARLAGLNLVDGLRPFLKAQEDERRLHPRLLILDQFEELFTQHPERHADQAGFFEQMSQCLEAYPHLSLLLSMREDYIAHLDPYAAQMPDRLRTRFRMERLDAKGALAAVKKPAAMAGRPFEDAVAEALVDNLRRIQVGAPGEKLGSGPPPLGNFVEPVHLQIVCQQLWAGLPAGESRIRAEDLQEFGDVDEALAGFYERIIEAVRYQTGVSERRLRNWFEEKLITPAQTRGLVYQGKEETAGLPQEAVSALYEAYLIRTEVRGGAVWYELSHDRLIQPILASNAAWQRAHVQPFQRQAEVWNSSGRPASLVLREEALKEAEAWASGHPDELLPLERNFLDISQQTNERFALEREARSAKKLRRIGRIGLAETILVPLGLGLGIIAAFTSKPYITFPAMLVFFIGMFMGAILLSLTFQLSAEERSLQKLYTKTTSPSGPTPETGSMADGALAKPEIRRRSIGADNRALLVEAFFGTLFMPGAGWLYAGNFFGSGLLFFGYILVITLFINLFIKPTGNLIWPLLINLVVGIVSGLLVRNYVRKRKVMVSWRYLLVGLVVFFAASVSAVIFAMSS